MKIKLILVTLLLAVFAFGCAASHHPDTRIATEITDQLESVRNLGPLNVTVESRGGVVVLNGEVASPQASREVERVAEGVRGVETVHNRLSINPLTAAVGGSTGELAAAVRGAIRSRSEQLGPHRVLVNSLESTVVLSGEVETTGDAQLVAEIAQGVAGVAAVKNELQVRHATDDRTLAQRVEVSLQTLPGVQPEKISVRAQNGIVTLSGDVRNTREADQALANALMVPGVRDVRNDLSVQGRAY